MVRVAHPIPQEALFDFRMLLLKYNLSHSEVLIMLAKLSQENNNGS